MTKKLFIFLAILSLIIGSIAIGYIIGYNTYKRSIRLNVCMAQFMDENGEIAWMYVGDDNCSPERRKKGELETFY